MTALSCTTVLQEQQENVNSVTFESATRGGFKSITIYKSKVFVNINHSAESFVIDKGEWDTLLILLQDIEINQLSEFSVPSNDRSRDVAWHSKISIDTKAGANYETRIFDNYRCPKELKELMKFLKHLDEKYNNEIRVF